MNSLSQLRNKIRSLQKFQSNYGKSKTVSTWTVLGNHFNSKPGHKLNILKSNVVGKENFHGKSNAKVSKIYRVFLEYQS